MLQWICLQTQLNIYGLFCVAVEPELPSICYVFVNIAFPFVKVIENNWAAKHVVHEIYQIFTINAGKKNSLLSIMITNMNTLIQVYAYLLKIKPTK